MALSNNLCHNASRLAEPSLNLRRAPLGAALADTLLRRMPDTITEQFTLW